jgi:5-hydroxyisourate hydrolase
MIIRFCRKDLWRRRPLTARSQGTMMLAIGTEDAMAGYLTTHVLDMARGCPAAGLRITLRDAAGTVLSETETNADGRTDAPILPQDRFAPGVFELAFHAGDYLRATGQAGDEPLFLDLVPIRFGISDGEAHYHVPLLLSPFGYSTYRGS